MTGKGAEFLRENHGVPEEKIDLIPHGIPDTPFIDPNFYKDQFGLLGEKVSDKAWHPAGCEHCGRTGYYDRTGVFEVLPVEERVYDLILAGEDEHALREHLRAAGFRPLLRDAPDKAAEGITDLSELTRIGAHSYLERPVPKRTGS